MHWALGLLVHDLELTFRVEVLRPGICDVVHDRVNEMETLWLRLRFQDQVSHEKAPAIPFPF